MGVKYQNSQDILFFELKKKVADYLSTIKDIGFAAGEYELINKEINTTEGLLETVCSIIDTSKELNQIIEQSPTSIYVADTDGKTLRINQTFVNLTGLDRQAFLGKNTSQIEEQNTFNPSVCSLVLKEKRKVMVPQTICSEGGENEFIVAGTPILNEKGEIFRAITNAMLYKEILRIIEYFNESKAEGSPATQKLIAKSQEMKDVVHIADMIKNTPSTILITGETGVGKSLLARYIHSTGIRREKRMTEINCGAIPPALLESELFGYVSGAFTGADKKGKAGLIEVSEGGTILLDEISELPLLLQVKLLHFLQNRTITRVGGTEEIPVDVRVVAATNKNLDELVEKGEFREDLFYRLNVIPIEIPPLRDRKDDIVPALNYFANKYIKLYNKTIVIDEDLIQRFKSNPWHGNLRELENSVERLILTEGSVEFIEDSIASRRQMYDGMDYERTAEIERKLNDKEDEGKTISDVEREMVIQAYNKYHSSYKVAEVLGISQSAAYRKIKKYVK